MKNLQKALIAVIASSVMTMSAQAAISYGAGQSYVGAKVGQYNPDVDAVDLDDAVSYGVYGGYKFAPEIGIEAEYLTTSDEEVFNDAFEKLEYSADVYGLYATYDYAFPNTTLYAKGRLGIAKNELDLEYTDKEDSEFSADDSYSETGIAGGLGLGYNFTPMVSTEVMYNYYPSIDVEGDDFDASGITLGAHFKF
ncbi:porin family protein [Psychrobacter sp. NPDC078631]|uniref:porin family protein n=1 Tax=Psychrobacter sp. NPDC078631 TaxID=3390666 RepID=UPI003D089E2D